MILTLRTGPYELSPDAIAALQQKYPCKAVERELGLMLIWLLRNPGNRPKSFWRFCDHWMDKADDFVKPQPKVAAWWSTDERTINQGLALGLSARPGEPMAAFRDRISTAMGRAQ
jgi:hypothetical protein